MARGTFFYLTCSTGILTNSLKIAGTPTCPVIIHQTASVVLPGKQSSVPETI